MDDQVLVRGMHGGAHAAKEREPFGHREPVPIAVHVDVLAIHVLHHHVRDAIGRGAAIEQTRDVAMIQPRQDLALGPQAIVVRWLTSPGRTSLTAT